MHLIDVLYFAVNSIIVNALKTLVWKMLFLWWKKCTPISQHNIHTPQPLPLCKMCCYELQWNQIILYQTAFISFHLKLSTFATCSCYSLVLQITYNVGSNYSYHIIKCWITIYHNINIYAVSVSLLSFLLLKTRDLVNVVVHF